jgi:hypothetical protein
MSYYQLNLTTTVSLTNPVTMCQGVFTLTTTLIHHFFTHVPSTCTCVGGPNIGPLTDAKLAFLLGAADHLRRNPGVGIEGGGGGGGGKVLDASDRAGVAFVFLANVLGVAEQLFSDPRLVLRVPSDDEITLMDISVANTWDVLTKRLALRPVPESALSAEGLGLF